MTELALSAAVGREARAGSMTFQYSGSLQSFDVTTTGTYLIAAAGAQGGGSGNSCGGLGAQISGEITLTAGTELEIVVGGMGLPGSGGASGGGGGGGSFIYVSDTSSPLLVAGGGGGAGSQSDGGSGQTGTAGQADVDSGGAGGTNGNGGGSGFGGGGGGGW